MTMNVKWRRCVQNAVCVMRTIIERGCSTLSGAGDKSVACSSIDDNALCVANGKKEKEREKGSQGEQQTVHFR